MKKLIFLFFALNFLPFNISAQYESKNIELLSNWKDEIFDYSGLDAHYNSVWGWYDATKKREYAILGGKNGTYFIEVTNPKNPILRDYVKGKQSNCIWREYKSYKNYAYLISDDAPPNSFQIVDMSYLPDSVNVVYDSNDIFETAHTLYIDKDILYCAHVRQKDGTKASMAAYSLENPEKPKLLRTLNEDYPFIKTVHDMFVRNDTIYASAGFQGLYIFKLTEDNRFLMLGSITSYTQAGYNHSSWLTPDGKTLVFCDEVPEALPVKIADVSDITDIKITADFVSNPGATAHNPYIVGEKYLILAYYQDGIQIYDIGNPYTPVRTAYFDTHPQNENNYDVGKNYNGCWGAYPFLPSGNLLASDRQNGLFVLDAGLKALIKPLKPFEFKIYPNPFNDKFTIQLPDTLEQINVSVTDFSGKILFKETIFLDGVNYFDLTMKSTLSNGIYYLNITGNGIDLSQKILRFKD
jgi:choice-of-anchor B domain-containing protein